MKKHHTHLSLSAELHPIRLIGHAHYDIPYGYPTDIVFIETIFGTPLHTQLDHELMRLDMLQHILRRLLITTME